MLWLSAGRLLTWVVRIRPEKASQTLVFSFCAHNRKGTLHVRLDTAYTPTKWLSVTFKAILCLNVWYGDKKTIFYCDPHARQVANSCVAEITAGLLEPGRQDHRSITPKFVTPIALSCIDNSWRSTTLESAQKLTSSTANLEWCHVHFIRDSYSTFIRQVIRPSKNSMELFCKAKFDLKSTWNRDSATSHHKHPVCQSPAGDAEKLTNDWSRYFGTNRIIDNWHRCLGVMWRKRKNYFDE